MDKEAQLLVDKVKANQEAVKDAEKHFKVLCEEGMAIEKVQNALYRQFLDGDNSTADELRVALKRVDAHHVLRREAHKRIALIREDRCELLGGLTRILLEKECGIALEEDYIAVRPKIR